MPQYFVGIPEKGMTIAEEGYGKGMVYDVTVSTDRCIITVKWDNGRKGGGVSIREAPYNGACGWLQSASAADGKQFHWTFELLDCPTSKYHHGDRVATIKGWPPFYKVGDTGTVQGGWDKEYRVLFDRSRRFKKGEWWVPEANLKGLKKIK